MIPLGILFLVLIAAAYLIKIGRSQKNEEIEHRIIEQNEYDFEYLKKQKDFEFRLKSDPAFLARMRDIVNPKK